MIAFSSDKPFVNRKKNKYTEAKYNLLLKEILIEKELIEKELIEKWDNIFGDRLTNNDTFEELLLKDLLAKKLSLIQVGQFLLIRQGAYDKVGVYYDASASAYQIMGTINKDRKLCQLSNVLAFQENISCYENTKVDIYAFFLNELNHALKDLNFDTTNDKLIANYMDYFNNNLNRTLIKAIIMPLIYGKTRMGLAEDLKKFFEKVYYSQVIKYL